MIRKALLAACALLLGAAAPEPQARFELGRRLFYDADLSRDGTVACATCHVQRHAFADSVRTHPGVDDTPGRRNVPGLANVGHFSPLTWADPRQTTLEAQLLVPVFGTHPVEMGMAIGGGGAEIARRLARDPCYRQMFAAAFPGEAQPLDFAHAARAIAAFEAALVSRGSPFDHGALSAGARQGQALFRRDCAGCHSGADFTDLRFHRLGAPDPAASDQGLFEATGREADRARFRTPSLRNVMETGPWWHDGSAPSVEAAIARHGNAYPAAQQASLLAFLAALTDRAFMANPAFALPQQACGKAL